MQKIRNFLSFFTTYEKIWFLSIVVLSIIFSIIFPETDDPTYTLTLTKDAYTAESAGTEAAKLDFHGTSGAFVITSVTVDGREYAVRDFAGSVEYTVTGEDEETLVLPLPEPVTGSSELSLEIYPDEDGGVLRIAAPGEDGKVLFYTESADLSEGVYAGHSVKENPPKYLVSVGFVLFLYLLDIFSNVACELLISKQSKWNFLVSLVVEVVEIAICIVCAYRFATLAVTLCFWIPCDIVSFFVWNRHRDEKDDELTVVKTLTPLQDLFVVLGIAVWTAVVGYLLTFIEVEGGIFANNVVYKNIACYLDACVSAVGIVNGLFILFRYREQWIAWYISAAIETVINIMAGQWLLLVLKAGYFTNTTYGYVKWTRYIRNRKQEKLSGEKSPDEA